MILRMALFALLALGLGGFGMVAWISTRPPGATEAAAAPAPPPALTKVLVAAHALRAGSLLKPDDVTSLDIAIAKVPDGASVDTPQERAQLWGAMVRRSLGAAEPVLPSDVLRPGDHGFLAAVLGRGAHSADPQSGAVPPAGAGSHSRRSRVHRAMTG